ncbi:MULTISPECIES: galactose ABC transporter substrate-binding protein [unclassified Clostridium]|uniref:galactose ABC transporter substrate-binding protein n=1 Tax=unclassified Clostridium TaxID=2614128 RepID=UPI0002983ED1|nr:MULTISPECIES: galactose ABC transporter substrate-binding protein [unclassified Clostridium]EKQ51025.1 MAG: ABC-type sugar transport system, periplasmic component [Clostridium sp. Maddingley MBC34-26]
MKKFKKIITAMVIVTMITNIFLNCDKVFANASLDQGKQRPVQAAVLLRTEDDPYTLLLKQSFEEIQKKNEGKIEFTFYDCKNSQLIQNQNLDLVLQKGNVDIVLLNLASTSGSQYIINKVKEKNIPVGLFNIEPPNIDSVRSYNKAYFVGTKPEEAGILQGKILINAWNNNRKSIDRNGDGILQYVMLMGPTNNLEAIGRTKYSILTVNDAGIRTQEIALRVANWREDLAREVMEQVFLQNGDKIEAVISNNDAMAIGAIEVLQKYGYNKGDKNKTITVVGVDAIPEAQELIKKGYMTGSVLQDADSMAEATYEIGMNLVHGRPPLEGTPYKFDDTGVSVRIPYKEYIQNIQ